MKAVSLFLAGAVVCLCSSAAIAGTLYGVDYSGSATLYTVNESTGALSSVGAVGFDNVGDLTGDGVSKLWGIQITTNSLIDIDPVTGAGTLGPAISGTAGVVGAGAFPIVSIAYDGATGVLYGNTSQGYGAPNDELYSINTTTGVATDVGNIGAPDVYALGFSQSGQLYGIDSNCNLLNINTTTGASSVVGSTGLGGCFAYDIASDPSGAMYLANSGNSSLYTVNLTTGAATLVGGYGSGTNVVGLAVLAAPEPDSIALLALGALLITASARRKAAHQ